MKSVRIRRALVSVSDKSLVEELCRSLASLGIEVIATSGTSERLRRSHISHVTVEDYGGIGELFDGRVKTLDAKILSAILFDRANAKHVADAEAAEIEPIDMVVCNFYSIQRASTKTQGEQMPFNEGELAKFIDVGGPTLVRAAVKNFEHILVVTDPQDYTAVLQELRQRSGECTYELRRRQRNRALETLYRYDQAVVETFAAEQLHYGENPHQLGWFVPAADLSAMGFAVLHPPATDNSEINNTAGITERQWASLSFNNLLDVRNALGVIRDLRKLFGELPGLGHFGACAILKHNAPCGLATATTSAEAFDRAWAGDAKSSFGGVAAFSSQVTVECARILAAKFLDVVVAPSFEEGAVMELTRKKNPPKIVQIKNMDFEQGIERITIDGGVLMQTLDRYHREEFCSVTKVKFPHEKEPLARFGILAAKWAKSNAVAVVRAFADGGFQLIGLGAGQPSRVDAVERLAIPKAREVVGASGLSEAVLASDGFFPFDDGLRAAAAGGIRYIVQPGGSVRDAEVFATADALGVAISVTGRRHFKHV